jgi:hypothetical protein
MKKFMLAFFGGNRALRYDNLQKAEIEAQQSHRAAWSEWMSELVKAGQLEVGYPLMSDGKRIDGDGTHDYHFPDTTEGGFIVIKAGRSIRPQKSHSHPPLSKMAAMSSYDKFHLTFVPDRKFTTTNTPPDDQHRLHSIGR